MLNILKYQVGALSYIQTDAVQWWRYDEILQV